MSDTSSQHGDVAVQNLSKGRSGEDIAKRLLSLRGDPADIEAFASDFRDHEFSQRLERVSDGPDDLVYYTSEIAYDDDTPGILDVLYSQGFYHHSTVSIKSGIEHWKIFSEEHGGVHRLLSKIEDLGNEITLYRSRELGAIGTGDSLDLNTMLTELTPRQRTAIETALELGYYEEGSDVTTERIANEVGVHQSTLWEHLQKAENTILRDVGRELFPSTAADETRPRSNGSVESQDVGS